MTFIIKKFAVLLFVLSVTALTGCAATGNGGSTDAAMMGDLISERAVYRAIYAEPALTNSRILVGCVDGIVVLSGNVDNITDKNLAAAVAGKVAGVNSVQNNLSTRS